MNWEYTHNEHTWEIDEWYAWNIATLAAQVAALTQQVTLLQNNQAALTANVNANSATLIGILASMLIQNGINGTFTTVDWKTITVVNWQITNII